MQSYTEIPDTTTLQDSRGLILNNDKTAISCSAGTVFPTTNTFQGMLCFRTDQSKLYELVDAATPTWKLIFDLNKTATDKEYVDAGLANKQDTVTGAASTVTVSNLAPNVVVITDANGKLVASGSVSSTELSYLDGLTSNVQTQLDGKSNSGHVHFTATTTQDGFMSAADKAKLDGVASGAEVNQSTFAKVRVGVTDVVSAAKSDTIELVEGTGIVITPDATNKTITFAASGVTAGSVGQSELKTSIGQVSTSNGILFLPGGEYGMYPKTYFNNIASGGGGATRFQIASMLYASEPMHSARPCGSVSTSQSWATRISLINGSAAPDCYNNSNFTFWGGQIAYASQRYLTASPPYNLGSGDVPLFVFAAIDATTGQVTETYLAEAPPWAYNGPTDIRADYYKNGRGYKKITQVRTSWVPDGAGDFEPVFDRLEEVIEVTQAVKNADMNLIPHPFETAPVKGNVITMLDPLSSVTESVRDVLLSGGNATEIIHDYVKVGNSNMGFAKPNGVLGVSVKWK